MSIPLDRLYHYIENIAKEIHGDCVLIYRFWPHGSKNIDDLVELSKITSWVEHTQSPELYCNDQEPLNWQFYENCQRKELSTPFREVLKNKGLTWKTSNFRRLQGSLWDKALILHSEKNSQDIDLYRQSNFVPVYYWTHAFLAQDWFRYARHVELKKTKNKNKFLIYNRAWAGTREYRLKFFDLLIEHNLIDQCHTWFNPIDPETKQHYHDHVFMNSEFVPINALENFFRPSLANSNSSADFDIDDYNNTDFEVVLETLFSEEKIHLTEKILRPIALGQPFLLASSAGGLAYLKDYGFKTFDSVWNETYDTIVDHKQRLNAIIKTMIEIVNWTDQQRLDYMIKVKEITDYNRKHFFSENFFNHINNELKNNLTQALTELKNTNTSEYYLENRLQTRSDPEIYELLQTTRTEKEAFEVFKKAEYYYLRSLARR